MNAQIIRTDDDGFRLTIVWESTGIIRNWSGFDSYFDADNLLEKIESGQSQIDPMTGERRGA